jgi:hypothetical protein
MSIWHDFTQCLQAVIRPGSGRFIVDGCRVRCPNCQGEEFTEDSAPMRTVGVSVTLRTWATDKIVTSLIYNNCGLSQWFEATPQGH